MSMQFWVPFLALALAYVRRNEIQAAIQTAARGSRNFWQKGNPLLLIVACLGLLLSHFVYIKSVAVLSLLLMLVGTVYWLYGSAALKATWVPIAFSLLTIPPPDTLVDRLRSLSIGGALSATNLFYDAIGMQATVNLRGFLDFPGRNYSVEFNDAMALSSLFLPALTLIWFYALLRRYNVRQTVTFLVIGAIITLILGVLQCIIIAFVQGINPKLAGILKVDGITMLNDFVDDNGRFSLYKSTMILVQYLLATFWIGASLGLTALLGRGFKLKTEQIARPTGTVANRVGMGINVIISPLVKGIEALGKIGTLFQRSERGLEKILRRLSKSKKNKGY
jgi:hypothetical protein